MNMVKNAIRETPEIEPVNLPELALGQVRRRVAQAFEGDTFNWLDVKHLAKDLDVPLKGKRAKVLQVSEGVRFESMSDQEMEDLAMTLIRFFGLEDGGPDQFPPSRLRELVASVQGSTPYLTGVSGSKIHAIKVYRRSAGTGLRMAKDVVDEIDDGRHIELPSNMSVKAAEEAGFEIRYM